MHFEYLRVTTDHTETTDKVTDQVAQVFHLVVQAMDLDILVESLIYKETIILEIQWQHNWL
jgi:hypothetical protein